MGAGFARYVFALICALIAGVGAFYFVRKPLPEITRTEFVAEVHAGHVHE
jgi:hypothetical protein